MLAGTASVKQHAGVESGTGTAQGSLHHPSSFLTHAQQRWERPDKLFPSLMSEPGGGVSHFLPRLFPFKHAFSSVMLLRNLGDYVLVLFGGRNRLKRLQIKQ